MARRGMLCHCHGSHGMALRRSMPWQWHGMPCRAMAWHSMPCHGMVCHGRPWIPDDSQALCGQPPPPLPQASCRADPQGPLQAPPPSNVGSTPSSSGFSERGEDFSVIKANILWEKNILSLIKTFMILSFFDGDCFLRSMIIFLDQGNVCLIHENSFPFGRLGTWYKIGAGLVRNCHGWH